MASNPIADNILLNMKMKTKALKEGFARLAEQSTPAVPEAIFVRDFLPFFSGEATENAPELLSAWYLIAGTPYSPVNVVNTLGQTVAVVPPILSRDIAFPDSKVGGSLAHAFEIARQSSAMSPRLASRMIEDQITARYTPSASLAEAEQAKVDWAALMAHYGKGPKVPSVKDARAQESDLDW